MVNRFEVVVTVLLHHNEVTKIYILMTRNKFINQEFHQCLCHD